MSRTVTVGLDGSPESRAAADWAAREAVLHSAALRVVYAGEQQPSSYVPFGGEDVAPPGTDRAAHLLHDAETVLAHRHPGLRVTAERLPGRPAGALLDAARNADVLVLGSRGLGRAAGYLLGSLATTVVSRTERPVVLVRAGAEAADEHQPDAAGIASENTPYRDVVVGLELYDQTHDDVLWFAFEAAARRAAVLKVVHGWRLPPYGTAWSGTPDQAQQDELEARGQQTLEALLEPWRAKYPGVEVVKEAVVGQAGAHLVDASRGASLVVMGRRSRGTALVGTLIGPVTHEVLRNAAAPVVVVPHD
ncbi:universal stress protein [Streptomyces sp. YIM S03343]